VPRHARIKGEYSIYHIIQRGNERKSIFASDEDKKRFIDILEKVKGKFNFTIYGFCIMDNHVHLLIYDNGNDISKVITSINISYAYYYNKSNSRCGHVFQDRFKSELVDDERYLLQVSKYIHLNPVKAKMVGEVGEYKWSSYNYFIGKDDFFCDLVNRERILGILSNTKKDAIREYIRLVDTYEGDVCFMEAEDEEIIDRTREEMIISNMKEAKEWIRKQDQELLVSKKFRDEKIKELRKNSLLSLREIGEIFGGIDESRISRILKK
jgi:putative transposase